MFRIKICGVTRPEDAVACAAAGADAIGLNFFAGSSRFVNRSTAAQVAAALPAGVTRVGVFVNATPEEVCDTFDDLGLDWIQLHGDEPPAFLSRLGSRHVIRALRCGRSGILPIAEYLAQCQALGRLPDALLVDARAEGSYGGSGQTFDWSELALPRSWLFDIPLVLAGGLQPENVAQAIQVVRPHGVDTASGVESSPGVKEAELVKAFVSVARAAFADWP